MKPRSFCDGGIIFSRHLRVIFILNEQERAKRRKLPIRCRLSFAGEDRSYVARVADALNRSGVRVFYDRYERAELWGKELYSHLDYVYRHAARYCVVFVSTRYSSKLWTNHERKSAQARAFGEITRYFAGAL